MLSTAIAIASLWTLTVAADEPCGPGITVPLDRAMFGMGFTARPDGLRVAIVDAGGPAAPVGIQEGDLVVAINGFAPLFADNLEMIRWSNENLRAGREVEMTVARGEISFSVTVVGRAPTCEEARRLSRRLAGGPPFATTKRCRPGTDGAVAENTCSQEAEEGERITPEYTRLVRLAEEHGNLTLKVLGKAENFRIEVTAPAGLSEHFSALDMTSEIRQAAEALHNGDHALFVLRTYPSEGSEHRHSLEQLIPPIEQ